MEDRTELARQAADPGTPLTTLQRLAQDHAELRPAIAANPSTYPALLEWLGRLGSSEVDAALATRPDPALPPSIPPRKPAQRPDAGDDDAATDRATEPDEGFRTEVLGATAACPGAATPVAGVPVAERAADGPVAGTARTTRRPGRWALLALAVAVVVGALLWAPGLRGGDEGAVPTSPVATAPTGPGEATAPSSAQAQAGLAALPQTTGCADVAADARVFSAHAGAASADGAWADPAGGDVAITALTGLQQRCDPAYAVAVSDALVADPQSPAALLTTLSATDWVAPARPAPPGAQERTSFVSPSGNIACTLGADTASCTITEHSFAAPQGCPAGPVTLVVGAGGDARVDCAAPVAGGSGTLDYGQAAAAGRFACTSEQAGVTCWSTLTGRGFSVARAAFSNF